MMTETDYQLGVAAYIIAALATVLALTVGRRDAPSRLWPLPLTALLLTPALLAPGAETVAPALIVSAFQLGTGGPEAAMHALRPLALVTGVSLLLSLGWRLLRQRAAVGRGEVSTSDRGPVRRTRGAPDPDAGGRPPRA